MAIRNVLRTTLMAAFAALALAGCAHKIPWGQVEVKVVNESERPMKDIRIEYGSDFFMVDHLDPNNQQTYTFFLLPEEPINLEYTDFRNEKISKAYQMRLKPEHRGELEFRFNREGRVKPISRFDVY